VDAVDPRPHDEAHPRLLLDGEVAAHVAAEVQAGRVDDRLDAVRLDRADRFEREAHLLGLVIEVRPLEAHPLVDGQQVLMAQGAAEV